MAKQIINVGATTNDRTGDSIRVAFQKVNTNFTELYTALGLDGTVFDPSNIDQHLIPKTDNTYDLGSPSKQWRDIFVSDGSIYIGDIKLSNESGTLLVQQVTDAGLITEQPVPDTTGVVTTDRLVHGNNSFVLLNDGTLELNGEPFTGGGLGEQVLEIDGGFASTDYTAEITVDGGGA